MINNDLISTFVIKEQKEQADIVQENNGDVDECSSELQMRQALINQLKKARLANNLKAKRVAFGKSAIRPEIRHIIKICGSGWLAPYLGFSF